MKHYTHFLPKKTLRTLQIGKQVNALNFDIEETQRKLNRLIRDRDDYEAEIFRTLQFFHGFGTKEIIETAKAKAYHYNNIRTTGENPNNQKQS